MAPPLSSSWVSAHADTLHSRAPCRPKALPDDGCQKLTFQRCSLHCTQQNAGGLAAGEMLHAAEPFLERHLHPTVIIRGFVKALEDALAVVDELAFPIDIHDREQMLKIIASCIGTKFTSRFGTLMPVSAVTHVCQEL